MSDKSSKNEKFLVRRQFIVSAMTTGVGAVCATNLLANTNDLSAGKTCGELTAADPLYLYSTLVSQLQPAAILGARKEETLARAGLSGKLQELWTLSDKLKLKLSRQSKLQQSVDRLSTLAKIGRINARAVNVTPHPKSAEFNHANMATQNLVTQEIFKTSFDLSQQAEKMLTADEWDLLQKLLAVINDIKTIYQPAAVSAGEKFDEFIRTVSTSVVNIQTALMDASRHVVLNQTALAQRKIKAALVELKSLASDPSGTNNTQVITRDGLVAMLEPILKIIGGGQTNRLPKVSHHRRDSLAALAIVRISEDEIVLPNVVVKTTTVKAIVEAFIRSGNWWQVVGVTAACFPLWIAYNQSAQRASLIRGSISAVPRGGGSDLDAAADALNKLTS